MGCESTLRLPTSHGLSILTDSVPSMKPAVNSSGQVLQQTTAPMFHQASSRRSGATAPALFAHPPPKHPLTAALCTTRFSNLPPSTTHRLLTVSPSITAP